MYYPTQAEFEQGYQVFEKREKRDAMYRVAKFLITHYWGQPSNMANGLGVLLLTWNQAFYRYGTLNFDLLETAIAQNILLLESFRNRDIFSLSNTDKDQIEELFRHFLGALQINTNSGLIRKSPVAVAKALHLFAPNFFPIWDKQIAHDYGCSYEENPEIKYFSFCKKIKAFANKVKVYKISQDKTLLKRIDEYNYSKYTKGWIS